MRNLPNNTTSFPNPLRKMVAFVVTVALVGLVLMFSMVLLAVILVIGSVAWVYLWWKTRELREQMRNFPPRGGVMEAEMVKGEIIEGEVIHVVDSRSEK